MLRDNAANNAKKRGREFALSLEHVEALLIASLNRGDTTMETGHPSSPSIDRVRSDLGYIDSNIQIVPIWFNQACAEWDKDLVISEMKRYLGVHL